MKESVLAARRRILAAGEVEAKFAGSIGAVGYELGADCAVYISSGLPHDAGSWCGHYVMTQIKIE